MKQNNTLRSFPSAQKRREFLAKVFNISLDKIAESNFSEDQVVGRNIENLIGATQIPLGIAGPLAIKNQTVIAKTLSERSESKETKQSSLDISHTQIASPDLHRGRNDKKNYYIPLATTEGALVASISRGCKAVTESGGAFVFTEDVGITRGPVFQTKGIKDGLTLKDWIEKRLPQIAKIAESTSSHLKLKKIGCRLVGKNLYARFYFDSQDAMGMNMATFATEKAVIFIEQETNTKCVSLAGNFDIDKKPAWLNFISGRGKRVWAECVLPKNVVRTVLKTTPKALADLVYRKCLLGSAMAGSLGFNAHYANIAAAIFIATGQDLAHVVEASQGITTAEIVENGDLYFSVYLPSLMVGSVGGGTNLPTQKEALNIMQVDGVLEYAQVVGAAILSGELSLLASLAEGSLVKAHQKLGRKLKVKG